MEQAQPVPCQLTISDIVDGLRGQHECYEDEVYIISKTIVDAIGRIYYLLNAIKDLDKKIRPFELWVVVDAVIKGVSTYLALGIIVVDSM